MKHFDLYGARPESVEALRDQIEGCLGRQLTEHESGYRGGVYYRAPAPPEEIIIELHERDEEGYFAEPAFQHWPVLLYINGSSRWQEVQRILSGIGSLTLLRSEEA